MIIFEEDDFKKPRVAIHIETEMIRIEVRKNACRAHVSLVSLVKDAMLLVTSTQAYACAEWQRPPPKQHHQWKRIKARDIRSMCTFRVRKSDQESRARERQHCRGERQHRRAAGAAKAAATAAEGDAGGEDGRRNARCQGEDRRRQGRGPEIRSQPAVSCCSGLRARGLGRMLEYRVEAVDKRAERVGRMLVECWSMKQ